MNWRICALFVQLWFCFSVSQLYDEKYEDDDCELENNVRGRCVRLPQCPSAIELVQKREHPVICSFDGFTPIVCCPVAQTLKTRLSEQKCLDYQKAELKTTEKSPSIPSDITELAPEESSDILDNLDISSAPVTEDIYKNWSENSTSDILNRVNTVIRPDPDNEFNILIHNDSYPIEDLKTVHLDLREISENTSNTKLENLTSSKEIGTIFIRFNYTEDTTKEVQDPLNITLSEDSKFDEFSLNNEDNNSTTVSNMTEINVSPQENDSVTTESELLPFSLAEFNSSYVGDKVGIVFGIGAKHYEFPHMAALGFSRGNEQLWQCGGSLVSEKFVLTAAHCLSSPDYGNIEWVSLGSNFLNITPNLNQQIYKITRRIPHPSYKRPSKYHDIALVELDRPVQFTRSIRPACLHSIHEVDPQVKLIATGWGLTEFAGNKSDDLQKVDLDVYSMEECAKVYEDMTGTRRLRDGIVEEMQFCAGGRQGMQDTCSGDSGGPLQRKLGDNKGALYTIIGVTSFGKSCGLQGIPGVYIRVAQYLPWLESIIWPNEF